MIKIDRQFSMEFDWFDSECQIHCFNVPNHWNAPTIQFERNNKPRTVFGQTLFNDVQMAIKWTRMWISKSVWIEIACLIRC